MTEHCRAWNERTERRPAWRREQRDEGHTPDPCPACDGRGSHRCSDGCCAWSCSDCNGSGWTGGECSGCWNGHCGCNENAAEQAAGDEWQAWWEANRPRR